MFARVGRVPKPTGFAPAGSIGLYTEPTGTGRRPAVVVNWFLGIRPET